MARPIYQDNRFQNEYDPGDRRAPPPPVPRAPAPPQYGLGEVSPPVTAHKTAPPPAAGSEPWGGVTGGFGNTTRMPGDPARSQADFTWGVLKGIIGGNDLPFGPNEINSEKAQAKTASENTYSRAKEEIQGQQAQTGFASSPAALRPVVEARIGASQQYGRAANDITQNAAQQNFNARLSALQNAQSWIDSLRSYTAQMTGNWWQRQQAIAQLKLAEERLRLEAAQLAASTQPQ